MQRHSDAALQQHAAERKVSSRTTFSCVGVLRDNLTLHPAGQRQAPIQSNAITHLALDAQVLAGGFKALLERGQHLPGLLGSVLMPGPIHSLDQGSLAGDAFFGLPHMPL